MNKKTKEIITESVLSFLNEIRMAPEFEPKKLDPKFKGINPKMNIPVKQTKQSIDPNFMKSHHTEQKPTLSPWINKPVKHVGNFRPNPPSLNEDQKKEIEEIIKKAVKRPGVLGFVYGTNIEEGKTNFGVRVDPTARGDWVLSKEEVLYELPISYNNTLHEYVRNFRKTLIS